MNIMSEKDLLLTEVERDTLFRLKSNCEDIAATLEELALRTGRRDMVMASTSARGVTAIIISALTDDKAMILHKDAPAPTPTSEGPQLVVDHGEKAHDN